MCCHMYQIMQSIIKLCFVPNIEMIIWLSAAVKRYIDSRSEHFSRNLIISTDDYML